MCVFVVAVADVLAAHKQLNLVDFVLIKLAFLLQFFDLFQTLLLARRHLQVFLVAPEDGGLGFDSRFLKKHVQVDYLVQASISNNQKQRAVVLPNAILNECFDAFVDFFLHCAFFRLLI